MGLLMSGLRGGTWIPSLLLLCAAAAPAGAASLSDYLPLDSAKYGTRTYAGTYGVTGTSTSRINGTVKIPYQSGARLGVGIEGLPFDDPAMPLAFVNDAGQVIFQAAALLGSDWYFLASDCQLSGPPPGAAYTDVNDGARVDTGPSFAVRGATCQDASPHQQNLFDFQTLTVQGRRYDDAIIIWQLDLARRFRVVDMKGHLGAASPTDAETGGYAVTSFTVLARGVGYVAGGDIDAGSGQLVKLWELTGIEVETPHPVAFDGGVVNAASFAAGEPVAPGMLASIFGFDLARSVSAAGSIPLPTQLDGVSVTFNGIAAPLHAIIAGSGGNPAQINVQVPWNALEQGTAAGAATVIVRVGTVESPPLVVDIGPVSPGVFAYPSGIGQAIAVLQTGDARNGALAGPVGSIPGISTFPAHAGDYLQVYANGLGAPDIPIANGYASTDQLRRTAAPTVLVGGVEAEVTFAGLSPWFVGVNQLNVKIPENAPKGNAVPLQLRAGGITTTGEVTIAIE